MAGRFGKARPIPGQLRRCAMKAKPPKEKGGSTENTRCLKSNKQSQRDEDSPVNTYGTHELCAWRVAPGQFWFQTTRSNFARKLVKRRDARRVEVNGLNQYRQTFELRGALGLSPRATVTRSNPPRIRKSPFAVHQTQSAFHRHAPRNAFRHDARQLSRFFALSSPRKRYAIKLTANECIALCSSINAVSFSSPLYARTR